MMVTKCDICRKVIKSFEERVMAGKGWGRDSEFCEKCGKPVVDFLKKHKLIKQK